MKRELYHFPDWKIVEYLCLNNTAVVNCKLSGRIEFPVAESFAMTSLWHFLVDILEYTEHWISFAQFWVPFVAHKWRQYTFRPFFRTLESSITILLAEFLFSFSRSIWYKNLLVHFYFENLGFFSKLYQAKRSLFLGSTHPNNWWRKETAEKWTLHIYSV